MTIVLGNNHKSDTYFKKTLLFTPAKGKPYFSRRIDGILEATRSSASVLKMNVSTGVAIFRVKRDSASPRASSTLRLLAHETLGRDTN